MKWLRATIVFAAFCYVHGAVAPASNNIDEAENVELQPTENKECDLQNLLSRKLREAPGDNTEHTERSPGGSNSRRQPSNADLLERINDLHRDILKTKSKCASCCDNSDDSSDDSSDESKCSDDRSESTCNRCNKRRSKCTCSKSSSEEDDSCSSSNYSKRRRCYRCRKCSIHCKCDSNEDSSSTHESSDESCDHSHYGSHGHGHRLYHRRSKKRHYSSEESHEKCRCKYCRGLHNLTPLIYRRSFHIVPVLPHGLGEFPNINQRPGLFQTGAAEK